MAVSSRFLPSSARCRAARKGVSVLFAPAARMPAMNAEPRIVALPAPFAGWFASRGWAPRTHQLELVAQAERGESVLLVAPTGGGKTLAGFLPSLIDLADRPKRTRKRGLHTLYISPLKAL